MTRTGRKLAQERRHSTTSIRPLRLNKRNKILNFKLLLMFTGTAAILDGEFRIIGDFHRWYLKAEFRTAICYLVT